MQTHAHTHKYIQIDLMCRHACTHGALIAFQKCDRQAYIHTATCISPWPTIGDPMPKTNALGNNEGDGLFLEVHVVT